MPPRLTPIGELAESVTPGTLPALFHRLYTRPEPHCLEYTRLILEMVAETLGRKPFSVFCEYSEHTGFKSLQIAELLWKKSFPGVLDIKPPIRKCVVIDFPVNRLNERGRGLINAAR